LLEQAVAPIPSSHPLCGLGARIPDEGFYRRPKGKTVEEKAFAAVENALSLDSELAEGTSRGLPALSLANHYPHEKAVQDFQRALALNPSLAEAHHQLASVYNHIGLLDKATGEAQKRLLSIPAIREQDSCGD